MAVTSVGELEMVLSADMAGFVRGVSKAIKSMQDAEAKGNKFGSSMSGVATKIATSFVSLKGIIAGSVAAIGAYKLVSSLNQAAASVDAMGKAAKRLGVSAEQMSVLKFAAGEAGIEFESLASMVGKFNKTIGESLGAGSSSISVGRFAVALRDVNGNVRSLPSLMSDAAAAIEKVGNEAERADIAEGLFGKDGGQKFLTLMNEGSGFIGNLATQWERARKLNLIFTQDDVDRLTAYNGALGRIGSAFEGLKVKLMVAVAPALTAVADRFAMLVAAVPNIVKALIGNGLDEDNRAKLQAALEKFGTAVWGTFKVIGGSAAEIFLAAMYDTFRNANVLIAPIMKQLAFDIVIGFNKSLANALDAIGAKDAAMRLLIATNAVKLADSVTSARQLLDGLRAEETFQYGATSLAIGDAAYYIGQQAGAMGTAADELVDVAAAFNSIGAQAPDAAAGINGVSNAAKGLVESIAVLRNPGFIEGFMNKLGEMRKEASDFSKLGKDLASTIITDFSGGVTDALMDASTSFSNFGKKVGQVMEDLGKSIIKMSLNFMLMRAVTSGLSMAASMIGPYGGQPYNPYMTGPPRPDGSFASGAAFTAGRVEKFAVGGVVTRPTLFPMANGTGLMGEAGPEGVLPLERIGGKLGVNAAGAGTIVNVIDQRSGGAAPQVSENQGPDGRRMISVLIRDEVRRGMADGSFDRAMTQNFGLGRRATTR